MNWKEAKKLLKRHGWKEGEPGKHQVKMVKEGCRPMILPHNHNQPYPPGMTKNILKEAGVIGGDDGTDA